MKFRSKNYPFQKSRLKLTSYSYLPSNHNVNQFQTTLSFYFFAKRSIFERRKNQLIVPPNQFIRPSRYLSPGSVKKRILIAKFRIAPRLVYLFNNLKKQENIRYLICLSIPKKDRKS